MIRKNLVVKGLERVAMNNPYGFTYDISTFTPVTSGFTVAYKETQDSFERVGLEKVIDFSQQLDHQLVGGWLNEKNGLYYYDSIKLFKNKDDAIAFGLDNQQIAIFNLDTLTEIKL